ncbi:MAG: zf-HC2 domain-containing protein [Candidatus Omnitrophica bacterium]|nr:zf-HC2 domain-containing protein [Candidatus Omnitrophota bacterium]
MRCERIQGLILTDYTDGRLGEAMRREVAAHIKGCAACREFEAAVRAKAVKPLRGAEKPEAPAYLWGRIRQRIEAEGRPAGAFGIGDVLAGAAGVFRRGMDAILRIPKPALAFATVAMLIIAVTLARQPIERRSLNNYLNEQIEFMAGLDTFNGNGGIFDTGTGTGMEDIL